MRRTLCCLLIVVTATLLGTAGAAHAGGWAVVTMDPLAVSPVAGQPMPVGFTILQHGMTPYTTDKALIIVTDATGRVERFAAAPSGAPGHHVAEVTFAGSGVYRWEVKPDWFATQPLGEITVAVATVPPATSASGATDATTTVTTTTVREPFALSLRLLLGGALALVLGIVMADLATARRHSTARASAAA